DGTSGETPRESRSLPGHFLFFKWIYKEIPFEGSSSRGYFRFSEALGLPIVAMVTNALRLA
ncbi:MAG: hypothetical protein WCP58_00310, partial [bacterium]